MTILSENISAIRAIVGPGSATGIDPEVEAAVEAFELDPEGLLAANQEGHVEFDEAFLAKLREAFNVKLREQGLDDSTFAKSETAQASINFADAHRVLVLLRNELGL